MATYSLGSSAVAPTVTNRQGRSSARWTLRWMPPPHQHTQRRSSSRRLDHATERSSQACFRPTMLAGDEQLPPSLEIALKASGKAELHTPVQVQRRDQRVQVGRPPQMPRQDGAGAALARMAVADPPSPQPHRSAVGQQVRCGRWRLRTTCPRPRRFVDRQRGVYSLWCPVRVATPAGQDARRAGAGRCLVVRAGSRSGCWRLSPLTCHPKRPGHTARG